MRFSFEIEMRGKERGDKNPPLNRCKEMVKGGWQAGWSIFFFSPYFSSVQVVLASTILPLDDSGLYLQVKY